MLAVFASTAHETALLKTSPLKAPELRYLAVLLCVPTKPSRFRD
jgi:hypothetical protein